MKNILIFLALLTVSCQKEVIIPFNPDVVETITIDTIVETIAIDRAPTDSVPPGYLYNFYAASDPDIAPPGWHVPTYEDFERLLANLGDDPGGKLKESGYNHWLWPNTGATNESGFTALPGGLITDVGECFNLFAAGYFWSSTTMNDYAAYHLRIDYHHSNALLVYTTYGYGFNIRLVKDADGREAGETVTDYDGNIYDTIQIGDQVWTVQNFRCTHLNTGEAIPKAVEWSGSVSGAYCVYE